jgi:hypothetical protein
LIYIMHRLSENIRLCPIIKTLKMLLFTSFCPTHACTTPGADNFIADLCAEATIAIAKNLSCRKEF